MPLLLCSYAAGIAAKVPALLAKPPSACKTLCIPTAANTEDNPAPWLDAEMNAFRALGFSLTMLDLEGASVANVAAALGGADIIYVTGGNTFYLLEKMRACGFTDALQKALARGALYIGSSAGSIVCTPDIGYIAGMDAPEKAQLQSTAGLGLVDFALMCHLDHPHFADMAAAKMAECRNGAVKMIGLRDDQALYIDGNSITIL